jgi:hypothetical protein
MLAIRNHLRRTSQYRRHSSCICSRHVRLQGVVAEPWMSCSDRVTSSDALPRQSRAQRSAIIAKVTGHPSSSLLTPFGALLFSSLPRTALVPAIILRPPRAGHMSIRDVQLWGRRAIYFAYVFVQTWLQPGGALRWRRVRSFGEKQYDCIPEDSMSMTRNPKSNDRANAHARRTLFSGHHIHLPDTRFLPRSR